MPRISQEVEVEFSVYCEKCGTGLCSQTRVSGQSIHVKPCPKCCPETEQGKGLIEELKDHIQELYLKLSQDAHYYPTIPEIHHCEKKLGVKIW
jgi:hypothetical protein